MEDLSFVDIIETVEEINQDTELCYSYNSIQLEVQTNTNITLIKFGDRVIWQSEDDEREEKEDGEKVQLKKHLINQMFKTLEYTKECMKVLI